MKKRLISMLLAVLMVASLFTGVSVSAYADDSDTISYTMKQGDTVLKVCTAYGINYYTCKNAIMTLNGFTSDSDFRYIPVGKVIKIPASNDAASKIASAGTSSGTSTGTTITNTSTSSGDSIAYYLVPHTMQRGETVYTVCSALGISYSSYSAQIQKVNNLSSLASVKAGQTILFPQSKAPAVGTTCYAVKNHKVTSGETAYTICNNNGISYNGNLKLLQALNNKDNLNYITAGSSFYVPVQTTIAAASTTTTTSTATPAPTASASTSTSTDSSSTKTYALTAINTTGGTTAFYVNNKAVTSAAAGDIVTVVATPDNNYALSSLEVIYTDGTASPKLSGDTFVMPTSAVTANVKFVKGYSISIDCAYTNAAKAMVGGITVSSAPQNSDVYIVSTNTSLSIDGNIDLYRANGEFYKSVKPGMSFAMPSFDVTAKVKMKTVDTYGFYKLVVAEGTNSSVTTKADDEKAAAPATGSFVLQVNGSTVSKAAEGATVTVLASPAVGYAISQVHVYECSADGSTRLSELSIKNGDSFTMPANRVQVVVSFSAESSKINIQPASNGSMIAVNGQSKITYAKTGTEVELQATSESGYASAKPIVTSSIDGSYVEVSGSGGTYTFVMPGGGVEVIPQFSAIGKSALTWKTYVGGVEKNISTRYLVNGSEASAEYQEGTVLELSIDAEAGYTLSKFEIWVGDGDNKTYEADMTASANSGSSITVGSSNIEVRAFFTASAVSVSTISGANNQYVIYWVAEDNFNLPVSSVNVGSTATILLDNWSNGKSNLSEPVITVKGTGEKVDYDEVKFTGDKVAGADKQSYNTYRAYEKTYQFTMPAAGVDISISTTPRYYGFTLSTTLFDKITDTTITGMKDKLFIVHSDDGTFEQYMFDTEYLKKFTAGSTMKVYFGDAAKKAGYYLTSITYEYTPYSDRDVTGDGTDTDSKPNSPTTATVEASDGVCSFTLPASDVKIVGFTFEEK